MGALPFLVYFPQGCACVKGGHQKVIMVKDKTIPTPFPFLLGSVVRGQLSRQLSRHSSLPGKGIPSDAPGQGWEGVRVKVGVWVCLG